MQPCSLKMLSAENQLLLDGGMILPVMEMFYSVQGEGFNTGKAAFFIRVGGCDVGCHWCDVKEAWDASLHPLTPIQEIISAATLTTARSVVITGGEPLMYNLEALCSSLKQSGMTIFLETSGAYPVSGQFDWICLSPKSNMPARKDLLLMADELKVIIHDERDLLWAAQQGHLVKETCLLYLQPEWSKYDAILPVIVDYVMANPEWMISLQSHKFMNIP